MMIKPVEGAPRDGGYFHAVRFYDHKESLYKVVAEFLGEGLVKAQPALVIGTPEHRAGIASALRVRHLDAERLQADGDLLMLDAHETLATFMVGGVPNADLFDIGVMKSIEDLRRGRKDCAIRAYGEMVDVLWQTEQFLAAVHLELLWIKLARALKFSLLCGYAMGKVHTDTSIRDIYHQHTHIVGADGSVTATMPVVTGS
jgi:hypothetical protein